MKHQDPVCVPILKVQPSNGFFLGTSQRLSCLLK